MNENIDLTKILKNCPKGFKLYSAVHGEVTFLSIENGITPICVLLEKNDCTSYYSSNGKVYATYGECVLFPSKDQRDWSKFTAPWYKKERFNPNTLQPFDRVLVRNDIKLKWNINMFSYISNDEAYKYRGLINSWAYCIPYNDDTKHLIGTMKEAPDFYKYWED